MKTKKEKNKKNNAYERDRPVSLRVLSLVEKNFPQLIKNPEPP